MEHLKKLWETVYKTKNSNQVSWTEDVPKTSLDFIHSFGLTKTAKITDIGGGDSKLVDYLLDEGFENITVLGLFKTANIGDVVFATKGVNTCLGIGVIEGNYYFDVNDGGYNHKRIVKWITDKVYQYKSDTLKNYKTLFRPDTFSPTKVYEFILNEYVRIYPELASVFVENDLLIEMEEVELARGLEKSNQNEGPKLIRFFNPLLKVLNSVGGEGKPS